MEVFDPSGPDDPDVDTARSETRRLAAVTSMNPIRLLFVDEKHLVRDGLRALVDEQSGFEVVGQAASIETASTLGVQPDVVVTELVLPDASGIEVVNSLRRIFPRAAIFVLTDIEHRSQVEPVVAAGVDGYMLKTAATEEFLSGVRSVAQGVQYVQPSLRSVISRREPAPDERAPAPFGSLTAKEREVLQYLVLGHTNAEIASLCAVSLRTVEARRARVLHKLGVRTRAELVRVANHAERSDFELA